MARRTDRALYATVVLGGCQFARALVGVVDLAAFGMVWFVLNKAW